MVGGAGKKRDRWLLSPRMLVAAVVAAGPRGVACIRRSTLAESPGKASTNSKVQVLVRYYLLVL